MPSCPYRAKVKSGSGRGGWDEAVTHNHHKPGTQDQQIFDSCQKDQVSSDWLPTFPFRPKFERDAQPETSDIDKNL